MQPNGRNDRIGKIIEIIANTEDNLNQAEEILKTAPLTEQTRTQIEHTNNNRMESLQENKDALNEEFHD